MPVTMAMTMAVESGTAEAAICRGATLNEASIRAERSIRHASGTAIDTRHKAHRYRADRRGTHHGQDDTAGTFHAINCTHTLEQYPPNPTTQPSALKPPPSNLRSPPFGIQSSPFKPNCPLATNPNQPFH